MGGRKAADGWAGAAEGDVEATVDVRITEELALAGMAREIVRHVNDLRKTADLNIEDRIVLYLGDGRGGAEESHRSAPRHHRARR